MGRGQVPPQGEPTIRVVDVQGHDAIPAVTCDAASLPTSGIDIPTCEVRDVLPLGTNLDTRGWVLKPNSGSAYVEGGLRLDGTVGAGSAWARLDLPAGTHLSDIAAGLGTDLVSSSGIWWGGVLLEGGDLTAQLHYDSDGRFWTSQQGVLPDASLKGGYYESDDLAADALVDPNVGSVQASTSTRASRPSSAARTRLHHPAVRLRGSARGPARSCRSWTRPLLRPARLRSTRSSPRTTSSRRPSTPRCLLRDARRG